MQKSMTGFGHSTSIFQKKQITVDIKCLNSKTLDLNVRIPGIYREIEFDIRNLISQNLIRGKIEISINIEWLEPPVSAELNKVTFSNYYKSLVELQKELNIENYNPDWFNAIVRLPEVVSNNQQKLEDTEKAFLLQLINETISHVNIFRLNEGNILINDINKRLSLIQSQIDNITPFENSRIESIKQRIQKSLAHFSSTQNFDSNRFEQELIYYLEKLDVTEEKVRLNNHCNYFSETANKEEQAGRKLSFIAQEMGREINTLGSKAQESNIQKIVVEMKDELEKIKEQLLNIL